MLTPSPESGPGRRRASDCRYRSAREYVCANFFVLVPISFTTRHMSSCCKLMHLYAATYKMTRDKKTLRSTTDPVLSGCAAAAFCGNVTSHFPYVRRHAGDVDSFHAWTARSCATRRLRMVQERISQLQGWSMPWCQSPRRAVSHAIAQEGTTASATLWRIPVPAADEGRR